MSNKDKKVIDSDKKLKSDPEFHSMLNVANEPSSKEKIGADYAKYKILVISGKGGVGKSTTAVNLATTLADLGNKVGIIDLDFTGPSVAKMLGIESMVPEILENKNLKPIEVPNIPNLSAISLALFLRSPDTPVIWRGSMKFKAIKNFLYEIEWGILDYLIFDLPPGTSDEPLTIAQQLPDVDGAVIITSPQEVATLDVKKAINFLRKLEIKPLGIIENMSGFQCPHCGEVTNIFGKNGGKFLADSMSVPFLGAIPIDTIICDSGEQGRPFVKDNSESLIVKNFRDIIIAISHRISKN
ncbi:MAG: P-loop NTPase [Candidatus Hodarchaeales archaeon]|jgi:Mrp family chromosome partitioning ATPase